MMDEKGEIVSDLTRVLLPPLVERYYEAMESGIRFVHYTSAEVGLSIIKNEEFWMRNATCMTDYSEVTYGIDRVTRFFNSDDAKPFWDALNRFVEGLGQEVQDLFNEWLPDLRNNTYLTCASEHDPTENNIGRLSMWRGYGTTSRVALVLNPKAMMSPSDALNAYSFPVFYYTESELRGVFQNIVSNVVAGIGKLPLTDLDDLKGHLIFMLQTFAMCLKHPGFKEEREWRVVYRPNQAHSERIKCEIESINGVPQKIYKIPLKDVPEEGLTGVKVDSLIETVIIGPSIHPYAIWEAFVEILKRMGVTNAEERVICSDIPLRT